MIVEERHPGEVERLEALWAGGFGNDYVERNAGSYGHRRSFWEEICERLNPRSVLEVGCNVGGNLKWIEPHVDEGRAFGVDINTQAIREVRRLLPAVNSVWSPGRDLPFRDRMFDLVFTMGVLIHQPDISLPLVMEEMVRCSARYVLCGEYFAAEPVEVGYRGEQGALFKRDYGGIFQQMFPELALVDTGFLSRQEGWDDVTWWILERR